jgi:hypothetical protein
MPRGGADTETAGETEQGARGVKKRAGLEPEYVPPRGKIERWMDPSLREFLLALGDEPLEGECLQLSLFPGSPSSELTPSRRP